METKCEVKTTVGIDLFKSKFQRLSNVYISRGMTLARLSDTSATGSATWVTNCLRKLPYSAVDMIKYLESP
ncbi:uncharacterized protein LOC112494039 isoform X3 [Cephus cinctus]|uniref:Uncharacterized protein LOC112494039 isoform X3 n=1 Tax=Cephus cinctus TaxID=211228 RepID=A0AAJ7RCY2_CEPCN|nr:uncharacterized protein LOC112494039 isoform X3 [Cephus cinctus]